MANVDHVYAVIVFNTPRGIQTFYGVSGFCSAITPSESRANARDRRTFQKIAEQKNASQLPGNPRRYWLPDLGSNQGPAD